MTQSKFISGICIVFVFAVSCASIPAEVISKKVTPTDSTLSKAISLQSSKDSPYVSASLPTLRTSTLFLPPVTLTSLSQAKIAQERSPILGSTIDFISKTRATAFEKIKVEGTSLDQVTRIQFLQYELDILDQSPTELTFHFPKLEFGIYGPLNFFKDTEKVHTQNFTYANSTSSGGGGGGGGGGGSSSGSPIVVVTPVPTSAPTPIATPVPNTFVFEDLNNNQVVGGVQTLRLSLNPALNPLQVEFFKNGVSLAIVNTAPFHFDWDTLTEVSGSYQIHAEVTNAQGQIITEPALTVEIDQSPQIQLLSASPNTPSGSGFPILLNCQATDPDTSLLAPAYSWSILPATTGFTNTHGSSNYWVIPEGSQGDFELTCTVNDGKNPSVESKITINVPAQTSTLQATGGIY